MVKEQDANKRIAAAEAFLQKYGGTSDFKDQAYQVEMGTYQQLGNSDKAIDAGEKAGQANPDNIGALNYLSFAFPFTFKADDAQKDTKLAQAESHAKHGLEVLQKIQKPAGVSDDQFNQQVKAFRANFNNSIGFAALQRKNYADALTSLKAAAED